MLLSKVLNIVGKLFEYTVPWVGSYSGDGASNMYQNVTSIYELYNSGRWRRSTWTFDNPLPAGEYTFTCPISQQGNNTTGMVRASAGGYDSFWVMEDGEKINIEHYETRRGQTWEYTFSIKTKKKIKALDIVIYNQAAHDSWYYSYWGKAVLTYKGYIKQ